MTIGRAAVAAASALLLACASESGSESMARPDAATGGIDFDDDAATGAAQSDDVADETGGDKLDLGSSAEPEGDCSPGGDGEVDFSYIWIANSAEGTVSKIDTKTGIELGRYYASPAEGEGDPSRTAVNLSGDVAVAVRHPGGITKIAALEDDCVDQNGDGIIQTSTGAADVLPWGEDECVLWHTVIPSSEQKWGPRPTAWDAKTTPNPDGGCASSAPRVWVGYRRDDGHGEYWRIDGETGQVLDTVEGPIYESRPYGGAVDGHGDFWATGWGNDPAIRIDGETLVVENVGNPGVEFYGMALDADGDLWVADRSATGAVAHYDVATSSWSVIPQAGGKTRGIQVDREGRAWLAGNDPCRLVHVDIATETLVDEAIVLPGCEQPVGISIDVDGYVWVVDRGAERAYKVDPITKAVALTVEGLVGPYTYSDMTGAGLKLVTFPPQG